MYKFKTSPTGATFQQVPSLKIDSAALARTV
jgi:hypothetical protein